MSPSKIYDVLIIGAGPAGLSAALGLGRIRRSCIVFSNGSFRNDGIEASHAVLGHDHIHPQEIWAKGREQIKRYDNTTFEQANIVKAEKKALQEFKNRTGFIVTDDRGRSWTGRTIVIATGVKDVYPELPGYAENWPRNIYQCPFCDGYERRHSQKGILCVPTVHPMTAKIVMMFLNMDRSKNADGSSKVTILTNGDPNPNNDEAIAKALLSCKAAGCKIDQRKITKLVNTEGQSEGVDVYLQDESGKEEAVHFGFLYHKPPTAVRCSDLIEQLGLETSPGMFGETLKVTPPFQNTNVPGVFAAGDVGTYMTHVTVAMETGVAASAGIAHCLNDEDEEDLLEEYLQNEKHQSS